MRRFIHNQIPKIVPRVLLVLLLTYSGPAMALFFPAQSNSVWDILDHDYIRDHTFPSDITFVNETHGWVLSQNRTSFVDGLILHTYDGGDSWQLQYSNASHRFAQIVSIEGILWVTGVGGLFYSDNYGQNWSLRVIDSSNSFFYGVYFLNTTHGWTSSSDKMYKTIDGGQTWSLVQSWISEEAARMIHFVTALEGWAIGFYGIYHSVDGGESWEQQYGYGGWALSFVSETEAWAVADGWLAHMGDGETWIGQGTPRASPFPPPLLPYFSDIQFLDASNGWIVGDESEVIYTPNGGLDWYSQDFPGDNRLMAVDFINLTHGWAVGAEGYIYKTTQGNSLGTRLWTGLTDPVFLSITGTIAAVIVVITGSVFYWRKRRGPRKIKKTIEPIGAALE